MAIPGIRFAEEYSTKHKTPIISVVIWKFDGHTRPHIKAQGIKYYPQVLNCDISAASTQRSATCTIDIIRSLDPDGIEFKFNPMDRIEVKQGYNFTDTLMTTFYGFISNVVATNEPGIDRLMCQDVLKLTNTNWIIEEDKVVAYKKIYEGVEPMDEADRTAESLISYFLTESGIPLSHQNLDLPPYNDGNNPECPIVGNYEPGVFYNETMMDSINRICTLIGYKMWADPTGIVQMRPHLNLAGTGSLLAYGSEGSIRQIHPLDGDLYSQGVRGTKLPIFFNDSHPEYSHLLSIKTTVTDEHLRNYIKVTGAPDGTDEVSATMFADNELVPYPPRYRKMELRSNILEGEIMVVAFATKMFKELNRLYYTAQANIEGDARVNVNDTVTIVDAYACKDGMDYIVDSIRSSFNGTSWSMNLNLIGGYGPNSEDPAFHIKPIANFKFVISHVLIGGLEYSYIVQLDATKSRTLNGRPIRDYRWSDVRSQNSTTNEWTDYPDGAGVKKVYNVPSSEGLVTATLRVTDHELSEDYLYDEAPLSDWFVGVDTPVADVHYNTIIVARGVAVYHSRDFGGTWKYNHLAGMGETVTALSCDPIADVAYAGTSDGRLYIIRSMGTDDATATHTWTQPDNLRINTITVDDMFNIQQYPEHAHITIGCVLGAFTSWDSGRTFRILRDSTLNCNMSGWSDFYTVDDYTRFGGLYATTSNYGVYYKQTAPGIYALVKDFEQRIVKGDKYGDRFYALLEDGSFWWYTAVYPSRDWFWAEGINVPSGAINFVRSHSDLDDVTMVNSSGQLAKIHNLSDVHRDPRPVFKLTGASVTGTIYDMARTYHDDSVYIGTSTNLYISFDGGTTVDVLYSGPCNKVAVGAQIPKETDI